MRLVFVNQYYAPAEAATAQLLTELAEHLAARGHDVTIVCGSRSYPDPRPIPPTDAPLRGVRVRRVPTTGFGRGSRLGRVADYATFYLGAAYRLLRGPRPDVVVSLTTPPLIAWIGNLAARRHRAVAVLWMMDVYPDLAVRLGALSATSPVTRIARTVARRTVRHADVVVALSRCMERVVAEDAHTRIRVVHNWEDGALIRATARERTDPFVVLYSGNIGLAHEFTTVLDAAEQLRDDEGIRFVFVGSGPRREEVAREVRRRGLGNVELRPFAPRAELSPSLANADVHLVTLRNGLEGLLLPCKIYGILAAGRPTVFVGPRGCEIADILETGRCGRHVAVGDVAALVRALRAYRDDAPAAVEEGLRARRLFDERFARERGLREWTELLESLGNGERP